MKNIGKPGDSVAQTRVEETLIIFLGVQVAARAGDLCREAGYPQPTEAQAAEIGQVQVRALTAFVGGLREPGPAPSPIELIELMEGVALGSIERVLGAPPSALPNQN